MAKNPLCSKNYFLLWSGALVSQVGDKFYGIALAWWILQKTKSPAVMGFILVASVMPGLIIGPCAGVLIDKWPRKPILIFADVIRGIVVAAVTILSMMGRLEIWHIVTAAMMLSAGAAFFNPTVQAVIPQIVTEDQLPKANALYQMVGGISTVVGPILGGVTVSILGFTMVFLFNGISYLVSAFFEGFMRIPATAVKRLKASRILADLKEGFQFLKGRKKIVIIIGVIGIAHFFIGSLMVALPFLANQLAGKGVQNLGNLETMLGVGLISGTVAINLKKKTVVQDPVLFLFMALIGICYLGMGLIKHFQLLTVLPYMGLMGVIGVGIANASVYWQSLLQRNTPNHIAGRIYSMAALIGEISMPAAYGLFGLLLDQFAIHILMFFSGACLIGVSLIFMMAYDSTFAARC